MPTGNIYSFGDIQMITASLNAVAMMFNSPYMNGGSLIVLAFIIALMFLVFPVVSGGKPNYVSFLVVLMIYLAGIQPKMKLNIEDYYSGELSSVDNIPLIVGMPASIAAEISYQLSESISAIMVAPTATKTFKEGGFADPLKLILSLRDPSFQETNPQWSASFLSYLKDCAQHSPQWNQKTASTSSDLLAYVTGAGFDVSGMTVYYPGPDDSVVTVMCIDSKIRLVDTSISGTNPALTGADLGPIMKANNSDRKVLMADPMADLDQAFNAVTSGLTAGSQNSQQFIVNILAAGPFSKAVKCKNESPEKEKECFNEAMKTVAVFSAMDQQRIDQAASASIFAKTAIPMMNIMMVMFYLFSPILLIVAMMMPTKAVQILAGYIMFAIWTQSWLPTAMVINYIIQLQTVSAIAEVAPNGVNYSNLYSFYDAVATKVGLASTLFAMTPMLTMALLSGSVYGLQQLSGKMQNSDSFNEKNLSPDAQDTKTVSSKNSWTDTTVGGHQKYENGDMSMISRDNAAGNANKTVTLGSGAEETAQKQRTQQRTLQQANQNALEHDHSRTGSVIDKEAVASQIKGGEAYKEAVSNEKFKKIEEAVKKTGAFEEKESADVQGALALMSSGNGAAAKKLYGEGLVNKIEESLSANGGEGSKSMADFQRSFGREKTKNVAKEVGLAFQVKDSEKFGDAAADSVAAGVAATDAEALKSSFGDGKQMSYGQLGAEAKNQGKSSEGIISNLLADGKINNSQAVQMRDYVEREAARNGMLDSQEGRAGLALESLAQVKDVKALESYLVANNIGIGSGPAKNSFRTPGAQNVEMGQHENNRLEGVETRGNTAVAETSTTAGVAQRAEDKVVHTPRPNTSSLSGITNEITAIEQQLDVASEQAANGETFSVPDPAQTDMMEARKTELNAKTAELHNKQQDGVSVGDQVDNALTKGGAFMYTAVAAGAVFGGKNILESFAQKGGPLGKAKVGAGNIASSVASNAKSLTSTVVTGATAISSSVTAPLAVAAAEGGPLAAAAMGTSMIVGGAAAFGTGVAAGYVGLDAIDKATDGGVTRMLGEDPGHTEKLPEDVMQRLLDQGYTIDKNGIPRPPDSQEE